jgi:hypothetical protein
MLVLLDLSRVEDAQIGRIKRGRIGPSKADGPCKQPVQAQP